MHNAVIEFDKATAQRFRKAYKQALVDRKQSFMFQDKEVLTAYARYLDDYLVMRGLLPAGQVNQP